MNVIREDPANEDLLYVGTDHGLYVSLDRGATFMTLSADLPNVAVHDVAVQDREADLIIGTHGRSIYRADLELLRQLTPELTEQPLHAFAPDSLAYDDDWGEASAPWREADVPDIALPFFSRAAGDVTVRVQTKDGLMLQTMTHAADRGLNFATYDLTVDPAQAEAFNDQAAPAEDELAEDGAGDLPTTLEAADDGRYYLVPGTYMVTVERGGETVETPLKVLPPRSYDAPAEPVPGPSEEQETK